MRIYHFLVFSTQMCYHKNSTNSRWNRPWQYSCDRPNAQPTAEHFIISIGEILYGYKL